MHGPGIDIHPSPPLTFTHLGYAHGWSVAMAHHAASRLTDRPTDQPLSPAHLFLFIPCPPLPAGPFAGLLPPAQSQKAGWRLIALLCLLLCPGLLPWSPWFAHIQLPYIRAAVHAVRCRAKCPAAEHSKSERTEREKKKKKKGRHNANQAPPFSSLFLLGRAGMTDKPVRSSGRDRPRS